MSDDPETARQIAELSLDTRPLLVLDVDDVVMEFLRPFMRYLDAQNLELSFTSFRLSENIRRKTSGETVDTAAVAALIDGFFAEQAAWQQPLDGAADAIAALAGAAEVVLLTAMPHKHRATRRAHLDELGFRYPLLTTEAAKGPAIRRLRGITTRPVAFVDDIPQNLVSVRAALGDAHLFHLTAMPSMRSIMPPLPDGVTLVDDWPDAGPRIAAALAL